MEKREALAVLALFQANWAHVEISELTTAVWCDHLRDIGAASALDIAHDLIATREHFPTVWEFRGAWRARQHRERNRPAPKALDDPPRREIGLAGIRLARVALRDAKPWVKAS